MRRFLARHSPLVLLGLLCIALAIISPDFRKPENLRTVLQRSPVIALVAIGQVVVIITAGIDLSVGSVAALSGVCAALLMTGETPLTAHIEQEGLLLVVGVAGGVAVGLLCGAVNGLFVTKARLPAFIATLGMMMVARGLALLATGGQPVYGLPEGLDYLGGTEGWAIPVAMAVVIGGAAAAMLALTPFGRAVYATGGNARAARLSGVPVDRVRLIAYSFSGALTGLAGVMLAARTRIGGPNEAQGLELDAIAACVIGGASLMGGEGSALGAVAGALIMKVLVNFCNLRDFSPHWEYVLVGSLVVVLVFYDTLRKRKTGLLQED